MKSKKGSIVILVLIAIMAVVIAGAVFVYTKYIPNKTAQTFSATQKTTDVLDPEAKAIETVDKSDEVGAIQKDLNDTNFSTLDQDVLGVKTAADGL